MMNGPMRNRGCRRKQPRTSTCAGNLRRKHPLIAHRTVHHCAPLHLGVLAEAGEFDVHSAVTQPGAEADA
jgi:hypothetical protein